MKLFKAIDYIGQMLLLAVALFIALTTEFEILGSPVMNMYLVVGGWQLLSVIAHLFVRREYKIRLRAIYQVLLLCTIVVGILMAFADNIIPFLFGLLFWSPVLAIIYLVCSYKEWKKLSPAPAEAKLD